MKSPKGETKCICSVHFQSAKVGGALHHNRFLMFCIFWLDRIFQREAPLAFGALLSKYNSYHWSVVFLRRWMNVSSLSGRVQSTSLDGQLTLWAEVRNQIFQELTGNFKVFVLVLYLRHLNFEISMYLSMYFGTDLTSLLGFKKKQPNKKQLLSQLILKILDCGWTLLFLKEIRCILAQCLSSYFSYFASRKTKKDRLF